MPSTLVRGITGSVMIFVSATTFATFVGASTRQLGTTPTCRGLPATIVGTPGDDFIDRHPGDDVIVGLGGNDVIDRRARKRRRVWQWGARQPDRAGR